jgi:hypothetical protein
LLRTYNTDADSLRDNRYFLWCDDLPTDLDPWSYDAESEHICDANGDLILKSYDECNGILAAAAPALYRMVESLLNRFEQSDPLVKVARWQMEQLCASLVDEEKQEP